MLWLLACHVIAMVAWFAGLFYLPRLFVYHADSTDAISHDRFVIMERRLFWGIMTPAALLTTLFGVAVFSYHADYYVTQGWMHIKLFCVFLLYVFHALCGHWMVVFRDKRNTRSSRFFRFANEVPTIFLIVIVLMVVAKP